jgi:hypothetical protein
VTGRRYIGAMSESATTVTAIDVTVITREILMLPMVAPPGSACSSAWMWT